MGTRDSFVFYRSFREAAERLSRKNRVEFYDAVIAYALDGKAPDGDGVITALFMLVKAQIDANNRKRENGSKAKQTEANRSKPKQTEANPEKNEANVNVNVNVNENVNENVISSPKGDNAHVRARMIRPTLEDVKAHWTEKRLCGSPEAFWHFYESKGWKVGSQPMRNWHSAAAGWSARELERSRQNAGLVAHNLGAPDLQNSKEI